MRICVLMGSPRKQGNTAALLTHVVQELERLGHHCTTLYLYDMHLSPCLACRQCQSDHSGFCCPQADDMQIVFDTVMSCDMLLLATPIHSWYCTPPMKAVLDRLVYGMNKFYGTEKGPSLWAGKKLALITTCGYRPEKGADLLEEGLRRYCKHSALVYLGTLCERHLGYHVCFMDTDKVRRAREFARNLTRT